MKKTKRESIMEMIIVVLSLIIVFGAAYFASELKYCKNEEVNHHVEEISMDDFRQLVAGEEYSIIYLARPGCSFCQKQEPIVKQISAKYELVFNYLNTDNLSMDDFEEIFSLSKDLFGEEGEKFGTPTIIIVQNNKIVDSVVGYRESSELVKFFESYGMIK